MTEPSAYALLALSAFLSATLLPGSSEAALVALLAAGTGQPALLVAVASAGNVAGSVVNWGLGRFGARYVEGDARLARARARFARYGTWSLLLAWVPVIGDPLTLAAGLLRVPFGRFLILVTIGKVGRYAAIVLAWDRAGFA